MKTRISNSNLFLLGKCENIVKFVLNMSRGLTTEERTDLELIFNTLSKFKTAKNLK
jgi:hypothetical protein